jgi:hypothetical protein
MRRLSRILFAVGLLIAMWSSDGPLAGQTTITCFTCPVASVEHASRSLGTVTKHGTGVCKAQKKNGYMVPDPACTPGAINPTLTLDVLKNPAFRTGCVRDCETPPSAKATTYAAYGIAHPANNVGATQTCELDHLVSLEIGGADTLDNIWPQCGPANVVLARRYFKIKDKVENFLAAQVRDGAVDLAVAQRGIADDWTQFLPAARTWCKQAGHKC